jgi:hypothetical protein
MEEEEVTDRKQDPVGHRGQEITWIVYDEAAKLSDADWERLIKITRGSMSDDDFRKRYMGHWPKEGEDNGKRKDE